VIYHTLSPVVRMTILLDVFIFTYTKHDPQSEQRERMKAISLIMQCYNKRLELSNVEPQVNNLKDILILKNIVFVNNWFKFMGRIYDYPYRGQ
jgi:hypothetical protein